MDNNLKILLADAGEDFRRLLRDVLENEADFEVVGATGSGTEAAEMAARLLPDVVLTDMVLSDVDGLGLIEALNAMPKPDTVLRSDDVLLVVISDAMLRKLK